MKNAIWDSVDAFNDINTKDQYHIAREAGLSDAQALDVCNRLSRDNARTPMQWSDDANAGFTTGTPWLPVNANYQTTNVAAQETDAHSILNYYRQLTAVRKSPEYKDVFTYGEFVPTYEDTDTVMAYYRKDRESGQRILIAANFGAEPVTLTPEYPAQRVILSNMGRTDCPDQTLVLESCEVIVLEMRLPQS